MSMIRSSILLSLLSAGALTSCTSDDTFIKRVDAIYRLGCENARNANPPIGCDEVTRSIQGDDGESNISVSCEVRQVDADSKALTVSVRQQQVDGTIGFTLTNAIFSADGVLENSGGATFTIVDKANTYRGKMTSNPPTACTSQNSDNCTPCQIGGFAIMTEPSTGSPYVRASVLCDGIPLTSDIGKTREFTNHISSGPNQPWNPASFGVFFCDGI